MLLTDGRLLHGTGLPSERSLVTELGLSRTTVTRAYAELRDRGYAVARHGSGTVAVLPGGPADGGAEPMPLDGLGHVPDGAINLATAAPPALAGLASAYTRAVDQLGRYVGGMGYFKTGLPQLREAIAARYSARGAATSADQIIVTTGALEGTAAAARLLLGRGSRIVIESPTYPNSLACLSREAGRVVPIPITWAGSDLDAWEAALTRSGARAALLMPDFHNPTGALLDATGRDRLARLWSRRGVTGIVDETMADLVLDDVDPVAPMAAFAPGVVTVGSVSKTVWGGMRIGWIRAPRKLTTALAQVRTTLGLGAPVLEQLVVADLLPALDRIDDERGDALRAGRSALVEGIGAALPDWECVLPAGGLALWWRLPTPRSAALARAAASEGVVLAAGSAFAVTGSGLEHWIRTPYALPVGDLVEAVPRLARAWSRVA